MKKKIRIHWTAQGSDKVANALGYSTHNRLLKKSAEEFFEFDDSSNIAFTITPADQFIPIPGKFNILFTMWEFLDVPQSYIDGLGKADLVVVPCNFCKEIFAPYTKRMPQVDWEGVDPEKYPYQKRTFPNLTRGEKFRFLWVAAPNPRKGTDVINAVAKVIEKLPDIEMYIKTTMPTINWWTTIKNTWVHRKHIFNKEMGKQNWWHSLKRAIVRIPKPYLANRITRMGKNKNIIFDTRFLSTDELRELYYSAHAFVMPTFGEGWGLTITEAMGSGLPTVATPVTGVADYFDEGVGYPIKYSIKTQNMENYKLKDARTYVPDASDFFKQMMRVFNEYEQATKIAAKGSTRILTKFTWRNSALRLYDIVKGINDVPV